jgi:hypothetical protein
MADHGGVIWPVTGVVECKYWRPVKGFENGLTGLLWGRGSDAPLSLHADAIWIFSEVSVNDYIELDEKGWIKFAEANIVFAGTKNSAMHYIAEHFADYSISSEPEKSNYIFDAVTEKNGSEINSTVANTIDATRTYAKKRLSSLLKSVGMAARLAGKITVS